MISIPGSLSFVMSSAPAKKSAGNARCASQDPYTHSGFEHFKGLAKLGNIVADAFPSLAARETYVAATNFAARKQENVVALKAWLN